MVGFIDCVVDYGEVEMFFFVDIVEKDFVYVKFDVDFERLLE